MTPATSTTRTSQPHSSATSRRMASTVVSPSSTIPPGRLHFPDDGWPPRRTRSARGRKDGPQPRLVDPEDHRAVLEEAGALAPLGAAHHLLASDLDLVAAGACEAERRRRALRLRHGHDLGGRTQPSKPAEQDHG